MHVALSNDGDTLLAGSLDEDCLATGANPEGCDNDMKADRSAGAAYVFARNGGIWSQQAFLKASNTRPADWFGSRLALSGDGRVAAIGAALEGSSARGIDGRQDEDSAPDSGAVYYFIRAGTVWRQAAYIKASNSEAYDEFGSSLALSRDGRLMVVTSKSEDGGGRGVNPNQDDNSAEEAGAA